MNNRAFPKMAISAVCLLASAQPAFAVATIRTCASAQRGTGRCVSTNGVVATVENFSAATRAGASVIGSAFGESPIGSLRASVSSRAFTYGGFRNFGDDTTSADAFWADNITITGGPSGTRGYFIGKLPVGGGAGGSVNGGPATSNFGIVSVGYDVRGTGFSPVAFSGGLSAPGVLAASGLDELIDVRIGFTYGFPTDISVQLPHGPGAACQLQPRPPYRRENPAENLISRAAVSRPLSPLQIVALYARLRAGFNDYDRTDRQVGGVPTW